MKKRAFRTELIAELRELVAIGRRLAAVAEQKQAMRELAADHWRGEPNGFIYTRGPLEGQEIEQGNRDE